MELTLGDLYNSQPGFFSSVNITVPQSSTWEIDGLELSHICDISVDFTFIGDKTPSLDSRQFDRGPLPKPKRPDIPRIVPESEDDILVDDFSIEEVGVDLQQARNNAIRNVGSFETSTADTLRVDLGNPNISVADTTERDTIKGYGFDTFVEPDN